MLQRHFSKFLHCINCILLFFIPATNIYTFRMLVYLFFFLHLHPVIASSYKNDLLFLFICYTFFSYPNQRLRPPIKTVSQVLCLERLQSKAYFLSYKTELSQRCFTAPPFPQLHPTTFQLYQGSCSPEDCVKLSFSLISSFNRTRIHYSTQILHRKNKKYIL